MLGVVRVSRMVCLGCMMWMLDWEIWWMWEWYLVEYDLYCVLFEVWYLMISCLGYLGMLYLSRIGVL